MDYSFSSLIAYFLFGLSELIVVYASYTYLSKNKTLGAKLLFFGSLLGLLIFVINIFSSSFLFRFDETDDLYLYGIISFTLGALQLIASFAFAIGLYLVIKSVLNTQKLEEKSTLDDIGKT